MSNTNNYLLRTSCNRQSWRQRKRKWKWMRSTTKIWESIGAYQASLALVKERGQKNHGLTCLTKYTAAYWCCLCFLKLRVHHKTHLMKIYLISFSNETWWRWWHLHSVRLYVESIHKWSTLIPSLLKHDCDDDNTAPLWD